MKNCGLKALIILAVLGFAGCAGERPKPALTYYHGLTPQDEYFEVVRYTSREIEFKIRLRFQSRYMYHLVLEDEEPLAEGWFMTILGAEDAYRLIMKAKKGVSFEAGRNYRLCIGNQSPEDVARYRRSYQCAVDYKFVLPPE
jgi:hypothetical protein